MENGNKVKLSDLLIELESSTLSIDLLNRLILLKNAMIKANISEANIKIVERKLREIFINKFNVAVPTLSKDIALKMICFAQVLKNDERIIDFFYCDDTAISYYKCGKTPDNYTLYSTLNSNGETSYLDLKFAVVSENYINSGFKIWADKIISEINKVLKKNKKAKRNVISVINDEEVPWSTNDDFLIDADYAILVDFNDLSQIKVIVINNQIPYGFTLEKEANTNNWKYNGNHLNVTSLSKTLSEFDPKIGDAYPTNLVKRNDNHETC